ncbi:MAG: alanine--tRNA ligase-related protein [Candidatus Saccharimonadales bacterium]|jgi:alanyl-tRNA synthetase
MTAQEIRKKYLEFFKARGHKVIPRASLVPQDDPTTLFTGSGMQPLVPYLLGEKHPNGNRLVNSQPCVRTPDIKDIGDGRHFTFFEMLGNWSLGDYFKKEQLPWFFEFLTDVIGLDPTRLYVTCFIGDENNGIHKDTEATEIWQKLFNAKNVEAKTGDIGNTENGYVRGMKPGERIFYYDASCNWWSREGGPADMREGEPGGPDSEVFFDTESPHKDEFGEHCHPNCECGRFLEIGNSVFMTYKKVGEQFEHLPEPNVDFGGGLERISAAALGTGDAYQTNLLKPIIDRLEKLSSKKYEEHSHSMRVIADHLRAATFLGANGVVASNKDRGYVLRRLLRRAIRYAFDLGIEQDLCEKIAPVIVDLYKEDFPEVAKRKKEVLEAFAREEKLFRQTLRKGLHEFEKYILKPTPIHRLYGELISMPGATLDGKMAFTLFDTYGFPIELSEEEAKRLKMKIDENLEKDFEELMENQRKRSRTATTGMFKGGLADHSEQVVKYHTVTHLMYQALKNVLGGHVVQRGSNITSERTRFDFSHPEKVTPEQLAEVEKIVNEKIAEDLPVTWKEESTKNALKTASGAFGDKYGDKVKVYTIGDSVKPFSREICGGPHVEHTGQIGEGGKKFHIMKEEASSAGVRRIKAVLQ